MNIKFITITLSILLSLASLLASAAPRVAVVDFENRAHYRTSWHLGQGAADMLTTELVKQTDLDVFERSQMSSILAEQDFGLSGRVDPSTATQIGRIIGVDYIVTGAVTEFGISDSGGGGGGFHLGKKGYHATVDIRIIDVQSGKIVFADSGEGNKRSTNVRVMGFGGGERHNTKNESAVMRLAMQDLTKKISDAGLSKKLASGTSSNSRATVHADPYAVTIAFIDGKDVTLSKGAKANVQVGKVYKIKRQTGVVKDPATGRVIKVKYKTVGEVKVTVVEDSYSDGVLVSNKDVKVGDVVDGPRLPKKSASGKTKQTVVKEEPKKETRSSSAMSFVSNFNKPKVTTQSRDINIDAYDEDALEDYFEALKTSVKWLSSVSSMTSEQYASVDANWSQMWSGMIAGQMETSKIELEEWPVEAKQEGWKVLGKRIKKYNKLFDKHRKRIMESDHASAEFKSALRDLELVTEKSLFEA